jgi:membrane-associated phospholipid phosphatase
MNKDRLLHLRGFILDNAWFLTGFALFVMFAGFLLLNVEQGDAIMFFNERRTPFGDAFFKAATRLGEGGGYLAVVLLMLFYKFRFAVLVPLLGISVTLTSFIFKSLFAHDRPSLYFRKLGVFDQISPVEGVVLNGGANSFPSGHAMSAFALFAFLAFCLPRKKGAAISLFTLALLVGISRIYLVQHFLKDVYLGAVMGVGIALVWYYLQTKMSNEPTHWANRSLEFPKRKRQVAVGGNSKQ